MDLPNLTPQGSIDMFDFDFHSYVHLSQFVDPGTQDEKYMQASTPTITQSKTEKTSSWSAFRRLVDKERKHVCGYSTYGDMTTLLMSTNLWTPQVQLYSATIVRNCISCERFSTPPPNQRVSLCSLNRQFNEVVGLDDSNLVFVTLLHCMYSATRLYSAVDVELILMQEAIYSIELCWLSILDTRIY